MYQFDLLVDREWLLWEVGKEAGFSVADVFSYLFRYLATGSALLVRRSFRNPEKLKAGSIGSVGIASGRVCLVFEDSPATGVAYGSNSARSAWGRKEGVADDAGVAEGSSFAGGIGGGASGISIRVTGAGVTISSELDVTSGVDGPSDGDMVCTECEGGIRSWVLGPILARGIPEVVNPTETEHGPVSNLIVADRRG